MPCFFLIIFYIFVLLTRMVWCTAATSLQIKIQDPLPSNLPKYALCMCHGLIAGGIGLVILLLRYAVC